MEIRDRSGNYLKFLTYLIVIILVNMAGVTLFYRVDLTANKAYSISKASRQVVSMLSEPLTIKVFFTKNLPPPHNNTERYLHDLLEEYSIYANHHFNYRFYDVSPDEGDINQKTLGNQKMAKDYGIYPVQIQLIEKDEVKFKKAYMGLVLIQGDIIERISTITSTHGLEYRLTTAIQKLNNKISTLLSLPEKIRIRLFLSSSLKVVAPHMRLHNLAEIPERLEEIVKNLNSVNYGKLEFEYLDPSTDPSLKPVLKEYNILSLKWPALSGGKIPPGEGAIGLVMEYGDKVSIIPLIHVMRIPIIGTNYRLVDLNKMEEVINKSVESLIDINEGLGYLADHGTLKTKDSPRARRGLAEQWEETVLRNFRTLTSQSYTIEDINLKEEGNIPEGLNCLVIARPTEGFSDYELFQIDQFLMQGKSLALFLDAFKETRPPNQQGMPQGYGQGPIYSPLDTGLEKLLSHYGIRIKRSYVMDESCYKQMLPAQLGGGERSIYFAPVVKRRFINSDLRFMKDIKGLIAIKISPLELDKERIVENGLTAYRLLASSEKSWEMSERINLNPMFIRPPQSGSEQQSLALAYVVEGAFPSYFNGRPIPERIGADNESGKTDKKDAARGEPPVDVSGIEIEGGFVSKGKPGKIFLMASSEMLTDNVLDARGRRPNTTFIMNVLDYLNNREEIAVMRSKEQRFNPLNDTAGGTKTFVKSFNIAGLPVLVVFFGLFVWFRRHSRMKRIQMMFQRIGVSSQKVRVTLEDQ